MDSIDNPLATATQKDRDGTLTIQDTHYGYYRLLNGPHAGRVIIKTSTRHDHQPILTFADTLHLDLRKRPPHHPLRKNHPHLPRTP